ncbi:hypothetical protein [Sphingobium yanoikuyae]|uniref:hypothetical protein n=1 Tax=Sphingobium TaxID=165695 RepID=UPI0028DCCA10|nr:hypothetical protein [Sphingobium yanoikuyae]
MVRLTGAGILGLALLIGVTLSGILWGCPSYNVYSKEQAGRAALAEAQSSRQIAVLEARAKLESAKMLADAEVVRAEGAARANRILQTAWAGRMAICAICRSRRSTTRMPASSMCRPKADCRCLKAAGSRRARPARPIEGYFSAAPLLRG